MAEQGPAGHNEGQGRNVQTVEEEMTAWEKCRATIRMYRDGIRKAKAQMELKVMRNVKKYEEGIPLTGRKTIIKIKPRKGFHQFPPPSSDFVFQA